MRKTSNGNTKYIPFTDEQIYRANSIDIEDLLRCNGEILERSGRDKRMKSDRTNR